MPPENPRQPGTLPPPHGVSSGGGPGGRPGRVGVHGHLSSGLGSGPGGRPGRVGVHGRRGSSLGGGHGGRPGRVGLHLALLAVVALVVLRAFGLLLLPWWLLGAAALAVALLLFVGLYLPRSGIFARPLTRVVGVADVLALTFDDGPDPEATPRVLEVLTQRGHRATFFMIGARVAAAPAVVRQVVAAGCTVGNHAYHHSWLTPFFGARRLARELTRTQEAVVAAAGEEARPRFMRPPVGLMGPFVEPAAARVGLRLCAFSTRAGDASLWPLGARRVVARVRRGLRAGAIVALHDGVEVTGRVPLAPAVLHEILDAVEAAGLRSVTLEELAGVDHGDARGAGRR